ncbi:MAG: 4Fe-4S binding protein [Candidatus Thermoplasmatota archaeon]|nr:4Fe-4S binding protein [Candidatus Thermoplasmatota archaeon]
MVFEKNDLTVLTKDSVIEIQINKNVGKGDSVAVPSMVVEHFIKQSSYRFLMDFCICREAMNCKDYPIDLGCLFMGEAARKIPLELGRAVSKNEALEHVERCRKQGLVHLIGRDMLDETWLGVGSKIPLVTVCNCCPCCCLWRMRPLLDDHLAATIQRMPGLEIQVNETCTGCGACTHDVCFIDCIHIKDGTAVIEDACVICGRCVEQCPNNAIEIRIKDKHFIDKTIERVKKATS